MINPTIDPTKRLRFEPVTASHAESMFPLLSDFSLYEYTGGEPPGSIADVKKWFAALESRQSADGKELWLTWILFALESGATIGYVQATIVDNQADIAWLVGTEWQGNGYASEAASALVSWLACYNVDAIAARIKPDHVASQNVAIAASLHPTGEYYNGEEIWLK